MLGRKQMMNYGPRIRNTLLWAAALAGSMLSAISQTSSLDLSNGPITLRAEVIDISASGITASGSPSLSSSQGSLRAQQFTVSLDGQGKATQAMATGGVRFNLRAPARQYTNVVGSCNRVVLYPSQRHAVLQGDLAAQMQGPGQPPLQLNGSQADVYDHQGVGQPSVVLHSAAIVIPRSNVGS